MPLRVAPIRSVHNEQLGMAAWESLVMGALPGVARGLRFFHARFPLAEDIRLAAGRRVDGRFNGTRQQLQFRTLGRRFYKKREDDKDASVRVIFSTFVDMNVNMNLSISVPLPFPIRNLKSYS